MKKIMSVFMAMIMLAGVICISPVAEAADVSFDDIVSSAATIIRQNEGWYNSVSSDDNGALSVGWVQWHGNRALNLMKSIVNANPSNALNILGSALYNEILNSTDWSTRILNSDENAKFKILLDTAEGHNEQDKLASIDISNYISHGMKLGITSPAVLVYFADIENQCGGRGAERVATAAVNAVGSFSAITLEALHDAALADVAAGKEPFISRRNNTFTKCVLLGWDAISDPYEVWTATTGLNIRSGPGTQYPRVSSLSNGSNTIIFDKTMSGDSMWGKTNSGWLSLEYCKYVSGDLPTPVYFDFTEADSTIRIDAINTARGTNKTVIYTSSNASLNTGTDKNGSEAVVDSDGRVLYNPAPGVHNLEIPAGGFIISGQGTEENSCGEEICKKIRSGCYAYFNQASMTVEIFKDKDSYLNAIKKRTAKAILSVDDINCARGDSQMIVYTGDFWASNTGTNNSGSEAVVIGDGRILYTPVSGVCNLEIPADGFIISGHDGKTAKRGQEICAAVAAGNYAYFNSSSMTVSIYDSKEGYLFSEKRVNSSSAVGELPEISKPDSVFLGWYTAPAGGEKVTPQTVYSSHEALKLYPRFGTETPITFNTDGGSLDGVVEKEISGVNSYRNENMIILYNSTYQSSTTGTNVYGADVRVSADGEVLDDVIYGTCNLEIPDGGFVISGHDKGYYWMADNIKSGNYISFNEDTKTISVYRDRDTFEAAYKRLSANSVIGALPSASRDGCYQFEGWTNADGELVNENTVVPLGGLTLTAKWKQHASTAEETVLPTCTEDGRNTVVCSLCGEVISNEIIPATDHNWIAVNTVDATCTTEGYTDYVCANDPEHTKRDDIIPPKGEHTPGDAVTETEATCTENGLKVVRCTVCGEIISEEVIPATDHNWIAVNTVDATCTTEGYTDYVCANDPAHTKRDDIIPPKGEHTPGDAVTETEATCTENGLKVVRCTVCGEIISRETVHAIGHKWVEKERVAPTSEADGYILYVCENNEEHIMKFSYASENVIFGDVNNDGYVDSDDAVYLLLHLTDYESYPVNMEVQKGCDFNGDGKTDADDAVYLLYHTLLPNRFKLNNDKEEQ